MVFYGQADGVPSKLIYGGARGGVVQVILTDGNFKSCKARKFASSGSSQATKKPVRRLWGKGKGRFLTKGKYAAAAVVGTWWLIADFCDRTQIQVRQGVVLATNLVTKKTKRVRRGQSFLALSKKP